MEPGSSDEGRIGNVAVYLWLVSLAAGLAVGVGIGAAIGRIGAGVAIGAGAGVAIGLLLNRRLKRNSGDS